MCDKERLIELMHDFVLFDGGVKKLPRVHQYFGIKAAQEHVRAQGRHHLAHPGQRQEHRHGAAGQVDSGEQSQARVAIITDRDELDKQIEGVFTGRRDDLPHQQRARPDGAARAAKPRLLCSLVHKFGGRGMSTGLRGLHQGAEGQPSRTVGELFVFVDECHRTQSGKLHRVMKAMMPARCSSASPARRC
jgi:type I restriction enzyme R subunit